MAYDRHIFTKLNPMICKDVQQIKYTEHSKFFSLTKGDF